MRFFRLSERPQAERAARRLQAAGGLPVRVVRCRGRAIKLMSGEDERRADRPVERDRRRRG
ncbi:MAG TPA: hypothetical protein VD931_18715 [Baekduia sp.]|nr:hypothetical protein [Baekduia sp.]